MWWLRYRYNRSGLETPSSQLTMASSEESSVTTPLTTPSTRLGKRKWLLPKLAPDASPSTSSTCSNNSGRKNSCPEVYLLFVCVCVCRYISHNSIQDAVRKVYKSLSDSGDDDFGWNME